ncbi:MAG: TetR/AcrR family transcriptional regulator [Bacteroidales bacterium]|nr:TetR/AcrR family transcriptional regulator [Bacteroidales bacterium]
MVEKKNSSTEQKILEAAMLEFIEKGMAGARMQEIANRAGINKALLHYYYRSKDKLFGVVFRQVFHAIAPKFSTIFQSEEDLFDKIRHFVSEYISLIHSTPHIPVFVLHELSSNPGRLSESFMDISINFDRLKQQIDEAVEGGRIKPIVPEDLIINIISLCIFPIIARPIIMPVLYEDNPDQYNQMIERRKTQAAEFIINAIKS